MADKIENKTGNEEEKVIVRLFKDNDKYADDLFVGVNGKAYLLQRGVDVEVPKSVAEVLKNSEKQDLKTSAMIKNLEDVFAKKTEELK